MLEIKFDVTKLNHEERQDLASFILGFPQREVQPFSPDAPPLPEGASAAPISADAVMSTTVPEVTPVTTSPNPIVNIPPVPQSANVAATAVPQQTSPVELDSEGLPWDKRIHASTKTKIASGVWKLARGVEPNIVEAVKAELRALMDINTPHNTGHVDHSPETRIPAPPIVSEVIIPQVFAGTTTIEEPVKSAFASSVQPPSPPAPPASHYLMTPIRHGFVDFIEDITKLLVSKKLAQPEIIKACNDAGVAAPNLLAARQDLIPQVAKALDTIVASRI